MNGALLLSVWPRGFTRRQSRAPVAVAGSIGLHAAVIAILATLAVAAAPAPQAPVRVVLLDAGAGGGGSPGPLRAPAPVGEPAGPAAPPPAKIKAEIPAPPIPAPAVPDRPRIAAKPRFKPMPVAQPQRAPVSAHRDREPTPGSAPAGSETSLVAGPDAGHGGGGSGGGAGAGTGRGVGSGQGDGVESVLANYLRTIRKRLESVKRYPTLARRRGTEGTTTLARDGRPAAVHVSGSSGSELLDGEAEEMVERAAPFEPLPAELTDTRLRVVVPVSFDLGS